jgi:hypothetical protein
MEGPRSGASPQDGRYSQRAKFSFQEDTLLKSLVARFNSNWNAISSFMDARTPRQCRERYKNYLDPALENGPWTVSEEELLKKLYPQFGPNWVAIRQHFPNRSNNNIKNHWAAMVNEAARTDEKPQPANQSYPDEGFAKGTPMRHPGGQSQHDDRPFSIQALLVNE